MDLFQGVEWSVCVCVCECVCVCVCVFLLGGGGFGGGGGLVSLDYVVGSMLVVLTSFSLVKPSYIVSGK